MKSINIAATGVVCFFSVASAISVKDAFHFRSLFHLPGREWNTIVPKMGNSTFEQYIDHDQPSHGTFSQFYYYSDQYWAGPGSPVVLFTRNLVIVI